MFTFIGVSPPPPLFVPADLSISVYFFPLKLKCFLSFQIKFYQSLIIAKISCTIIAHMPTRSRRLHLSVFEQHNLSSKASHEKMPRGKVSDEIRLKIQLPVLFFFFF